jgi:hypothetical protein
VNPDWLKNYEPLCNTLLEYGWFVAPYLIGKDFEKVKELCLKLNSHPPTSEKERKSAEESIDYVLSDIAFHPGFRAFFVFRSMEVSDLKEYSHLYEEAIICYYKREYAASVLTLLPALEGVLLSHYGWQFGVERKPPVSKLIEKIRNQSLASKAKPLQDAFQMYRNVLVGFLGRWVYQDTSRADFSLSFLNRHFVLHGMGYSGFYRPADVHRLILLFDLVVEYLSLLEGHHYGFIPDGKIDISLRRTYYSALAEGNISVKQAREFERAFLGQHKNYETYQNEPSWANSQVKGILDAMDTIAMVAKMKRARKPRQDV